MRFHFSGPNFLVGCIAITLITLVGVELLPERTLELTAPGASSGTYLISADGLQDGPSVKWADAAQRRLTCRYAQVHGYMGCGLTFMLSGADPSRGMDLGDFDSVELDLVYKGPSPFIRLGVRHFDPRFSKPEDSNSARFHSINLRPRDVGKPVQVQLSELTVPEWWILGYDFPREYNRPDISNAVSVTVELLTVLPDQLHDLEVRRVTLRGHWVSRDRVYLGILCAWLLGAVLLVVNSWAQLRRSHLRQQREIDALTQRTAQLRVEQEKLRRLATIDELTGVLNRRGLEQSLEDLENAAQGMTLVILDIDHFKHINDRYGHDCGDEVLRRVAAAISANLRASDVLGRWGGEEFLIACKGTRLREAVRLAEKLRDRVEHSEVTVSGHRIRVSASFGVAVAPPASDTSEAVKRADEALYRAKAAGRNRVEMDETLESTPTTL